MRVAIGCLYVVLQFIYFVYGEYSYFWGAFNISTHVLFVSYVSYILEGMDSFTEDERLLFSYIKYLSLINFIYIVTCYIREEDFAIYNTPVMGYILGIGFVSFIIHRSIKK